MIARESANYRSSCPPADLPSCPADTRPLLYSLNILHFRRTRRRRASNWGSQPERVPRSIVPFYVPFYVVGPGPDLDGEDAEPERPGDRDRDLAGIEGRRMRTGDRILDARDRDGSTERYQGPIPPRDQLLGPAEDARCERLLPAVRPCSQKDCVAIGDSAVPRLDSRSGAGYM